MIIGITGKSGVGKSTISRYIGKELENCEVIKIDDLHIQYLVKNAKKLKELYGEAILLDEQTLNIVYFLENRDKSKIVFQESYLGFGKFLFEVIEKSQRSFHFTILDFFVLPNIHQIWNLCDYRILVKLTSEEERYKRIAVRKEQHGVLISKNRKKELEIRDIDLPNYEDYSYDWIIENNGRIEEKVTPIIRQLKLK